MNQLARLGKNALWLLAARFGTQGLVVVFTILIARRLGSTGLGEYAFMASAIFLANVLTTFGTDMLLIRDIAAHDDLSRLPAALLIQLILSALFVALAFVGAPLLPGQSQDAVLAVQIYSLALFPLAFFTVFTAVLRGKERMDLYTLLNLAASLLQVLAAWLFVQSRGSVVRVAMLMLAVQFFATALAGILCILSFPDFLKAWRSSWQVIPAMIRLSAPIALLGLLGMLYQKLSIYMLATLAGAAVTGWFSAALRVVEASKIGHLALFGALYPAMAKAEVVSDDETGPNQLFAWSWRLLLVVAGAASLVTFSLASPLVTVLYGDVFEPSVSALRILIWMMIPYTINAYLSLAFLAKRQETLVAQALLAGLVTLTVLNAWWIPRIGLAGACWAALVAEVVQAGFLLFCQQRYPIKFPLFKKPERIS